MVRRLAFRGRLNAPRTGERVAVVRPSRAAASQCPAHGGAGQPLSELIGTRRTRGSTRSRSERMTSSMSL